MPGIQYKEVRQERHAAIACKQRNISHW